MSEGNGRAKVNDVLIGIDTLNLPIDPYSIAYWQSGDTKSLQTCPGDSIHATMDPPRIPLNAINRSINSIPNPSSLEVPKVTVQGTEKPGSGRPSKGPKRLISFDALDDFKRAVVGSDLTKAGLIEVLKKQ